MRYLKKKLLAALLLAALLAGAATAAAADIQISAQEWEVLRLTNLERMAQGLAPLSTFATLQQAAHVRSGDLSVEYRSDHTRPNGEKCISVLAPLGLGYRSFGENIAAGQTSPAEVVAAWMNSPGHRANILQSDYSHLGVGYGTQSTQGYPTVWEQMFLDDGCTVSSLALAPAAVLLERGAGLDVLEVAVSAVCARHGESVLPLIAPMCAGYDPAGAGEQAVTVRYAGHSAVLTVRPAPWSAVNAWARNGLAGAVDAGLIPAVLEGQDFTQNITRAEFAAVAVQLYAALGGTLPAAGESPFADTAAPAVLQAHALGIVQGTGGDAFFPDASLDREQAAVMLARAWTALGNEAVPGACAFTDAAEISPWALDAVGSLAQRGLFQGDDAGRFLPKLPLSRDAALLVAARMGGVA